MLRLSIAYCIFQLLLILSFPLLLISVPRTEYYV